MPRSLSLPTLFAQNLSLVSESLSPTTSSHNTTTTTTTTTTTDSDPSFLQHSTVELSYDDLLADAPARLAHGYHTVIMHCRRHIASLSPIKLGHVVLTPAPDDPLVAIINKAAVDSYKLVIAHVEARIEAIQGMAAEEAMAVESCVEDWFGQARELVEEDKKKVMEMLGKRDAGDIEGGDGERMEVLVMAAAEDGVKRAGQMLAEIEEARMEVLGAVRDGSWRGDWRVLGGNGLGVEDAVRVEWGHDGEDVAVNDEDSGTDGVGDEAKSDSDEVGAESEADLCMNQGSEYEERKKDEEEGLPFSEAHVLL